MNQILTWKRYLVSSEANFETLSTWVLNPITAFLVSKPCNDIFLLLIWNEIFFLIKSEKIKIERRKNFQWKILIQCNWFVSKQMFLRVNQKLNLILLPFVSQVNWIFLLSFHYQINLFSMKSICKKTFHVKIAFHLHH